MQYFSVKCVIQFVGHGMLHIYKASQRRGRASGSRAYGRHEMQGVIFLHRK